MQDDPSQPARRKVTFGPVQRPPQPPEPPEPPEPPAETSPTLLALEPGQPPGYQGLYRDERGIVVGAQGLVAIQGARRRATFLSALSHVANLAVGVQAEESETSGERAADDFLVVTLRPPDSGSPLSLFYDAVQGALAAARISSARALLCVGDGHAFVPYADPAAPHGYDVQGSAPNQGRIVVLQQGTRSLPVSRARPLLDVLLDLPLLPASPAQPPTMLAVLADRRLAPLIASYVQRHNLTYALRFLSWRHGDGTLPVALFELVTATEVQPLPRFVIDFLRRLPHTTLLVDASDTADLETEQPRRVLVGWGLRTPMHLPHVQELLPPRALLLLCERAWGPAVISPVPPRQYMQNLTAVSAPEPSRATLSDRAPDKLRLQLSLQRVDAAHGPVHGLLLDTDALVRLRRIVRHLPAPLFARTRLALGDGMAILIAADPKGTIEGLPLGQPLVRANPPELLLPYGTRLLPSLPPDLLESSLGLRPDTLTVLTSTQRYDVPLAMFLSLSSLLALDLPSQPFTITLRPGQVPLDLSDLEEAQAPPAPPPSLTPAQPQPEPSGPAAAPPAQASRGLFGRFLGRSSASSAYPDFESDLRQRAAQLEQEGEYEIAAAFYTYLKDSRRAAECYRHLLRQIQP